MLRKKKNLSKGEWENTCLLNQAWDYYYYYYYYHYYYYNYYYYYYYYYVKKRSGAQSDTP